MRMPRLADSRVGLDGQPFSPAGGNSGSKSVGSDDTAARECQSGLEPAAAEAWPCVLRQIQIHPGQRVGQRSVLFADRSELHSSQPGESWSSRRRSRAFGRLRVEKPAGSCEV